MLKEERFERILALLKDNGKVAYGGLARKLKVSEDTIRRDIERQHDNGLLAKVRGGAVPPSKNPFRAPARYKVSLGLQQL
jgi:DeoR family transcriptional regulator, carbon catabolite repression regulator